MVIYCNPYSMYGLNKYRSFLKAPTCDCGCEKPGYIILDTEKDVEDFCCSVLSEHECPDSAIFAVFHNGKRMAVFKDGENFLKVEEKNTHFFAKLDGDLRFCCYNLIIEEKPGMWMIR